MSEVTVKREEYKELIEWALEAHRKIEILSMIIPDRATRRMLKNFNQDVPEWFRPHAEKFTREHLV